MKPVKQERQDSQVMRRLVDHQPTGRFIVNINSLHNYKHIAAVVPQHLRGNSIQFDDIAQLRDDAAHAMRSAKKKKEKKGKKGKKGKKKADEESEHDAASAGEELGEPNADNEAVSYPQNGSTLPKNRGAKRRRAATIEDAAAADASDAGQVPRSGEPAPKAPRVLSSGITLRARK